MRKIFLVLFFLAFVPLLVQAEEASGKSDETITAKHLAPDDVMVRVNGHDVTYREYQRGMVVLLSDLRSTGRHSKTGMISKQVREQVLIKVIEREVLYQEAMKDPMPDLEEAAKKGFESIKGRFPTEEKFKQMLVEVEIDEQSLRDVILQDNAINFYVATYIMPGIKVTESEARKYYDRKVRKGEDFQVPERVDISHILLNTSSDKAENAEIRKLMDDIHARLTAGEDFGTLAMQYNQSPLTKGYAGLLGPRRRQDLPDDIANACFNLEEGEVTPVMETRFGLEIFKLNHKVPPTNMAFEDVKNSLIDYIRTKKTEKAVQDKTNDLVGSAEIEMIVPHL